MKIKKQHRKKKYLHKLNRKRMHNKLRSTGEVTCLTIKDAWDNKRSTKTNLKNMGLANDPNIVIKIPSHRLEVLQKAKTMLPGRDVESDSENETPVAPKYEIVEKLERESRAPRPRKLMLPKNQVEHLTYLLDKYGHDYKAMARDKKNYFQETWKQIRAKIKTFMGIPKQYGAYLKERGLLDKEEDDEELKNQAKALAVDDSD